VTKNETILQDAVMTAIQNAIIAGISPDRVNEILRGLTGDCEMRTVSRVDAAERAFQRAQDRTNTLYAERLSDGGAVVTRLDLVTAVDKAVAEVAEETGYSVGELREQMGVN
jgi:hypothetical protein